jgi:small conductance mechanosensitive channel
MNIDLGVLFDNVLTEILFIILVTMVAQIVSRLIIERVIRRAVRQHKFESKVDERKREDTLINIIQATVAALLWLVAVATTLMVMNINIASLATGAGFISVIIGLGAQNTIKDILAGVFILAENQYRVGDVVTLSGGPVGATGATGVVEEITLRVTKLRNLDGTLNIVRNGDSSIITNRTFKFSSVVLDITIALDSDIDKVEKVMNQVGKDMVENEEWSKAIIEPIQFMRIESFTDTQAVVKAIGKVKPASQWEVAGEYRRRILKAFKANSVQLTSAK